MHQTEWLQLVSLLGLVLINLLALTFALYFELLIFLDTVATAVAGLIFGWWEGALVGGLTNLMIGLKYPVYLRFIHVNMLSGVAWGLIAHFFPRPHPDDNEGVIVLYILAVGASVGFVSALLAVPVRILCGFHTNHLLDQVGESIRTRLSSDESGGARKCSPWTLGMIIGSVEYVLSHFLDKTIGTTVAVFCLLGIMSSTASGSSQGYELSATYHSLIELLTGYYYVALAVVFKTLRSKLGVKLQFDEVVLLLGPLGFFGLLLAFPVILRML
jgi:hypothetical protein